MLGICETVLAEGRHMLDVLPGERTRLEAAIDGPEFTGTAQRDYADALLGEVLVEGFGWGLKNDRNLLKRLHLEGFIDRIRTPAGAVFSSPVARSLLLPSKP